MSKRPTNREVLQGAFSLLTEQDLNPKIAEWLHLYLLQCSKTEWLNQLDTPLSIEQEELYTGWLKRVVAGEPYQYIIGVEDFFGREFQVTPGVLIPRPETEILVEQVLQKLRSLRSTETCLTGVDVGTGSGAIAITLDLEMNQTGLSSGRPKLTLGDNSQAGDRRSLNMLAVDISPDALEVAQANANRYQSSVTFMHSDLLQALLDDGEKVDFIVSNPPYVSYADKEQLARNVVDYEPHIALFAEEDGLYFYRKIVEQSTSVLNSPGLLAFEVGLGQAPAVTSLIRETYPQASCEIKQDLSGIERIVLAAI